MAFKYGTLFWKDVAERAIATAAQVLLGFLVADGGFDLVNADFQAIGAVVLTAVIVVVLKALLAASLSATTVSPASLATDTRGSGTGEVKDVV